MNFVMLGRLIDGSRLLEFKQLFGGNLVCGWGYLDGQLTGFLANAGPITAADAQKGYLEISTYDFHVKF